MIHKNSNVLFPVLVVLLKPRLLVLDAFGQPLLPKLALIPGDGLLDAYLEASHGIPSKFHVGLMGVDRGTLIMPMAIGDVGDEGFGIANYKKGRPS